MFLFYSFLSGISVTNSPNSMAAVTAAGVPVAMIAAAVPVTVLMIMMITAHLGIIGQFTGKQGRNGRIRITGYTAVQTDTCLFQRHPGTAADAAADQHIHLCAA